MTRITRFCSSLLVVMGFAAMTAANAQELHIDPQKVTGPDACGECHESSVKAWKESHHAKTFHELPRSDESREIASKMGIKRIKAESDCLSCHFTSAIKEGKSKPIAGISCESCHGAGEGYIKVHSDFGGKDATKETETPEHQIQRWADAEAAGMIRPSNLYALAENCYQCHMVPNEELVNKGGHAAGSKFELVAWSQGEVRHNVWYTKENEAADINRQRMMFLMGQMLELEYSLRGVSKATEKATYAVSMAKRASRAKKRLAKIDELTGGAAPELKQALEAASGAKLSLNNEAALVVAAEGVQEAAIAFATNHDGSAFAGIDKALPKPEKYKGKVIQP